MFITLHRAVDEATYLVKGTWQEAPKSDETLDWMVCRAEGIAPDVFRAYVSRPAQDHVTPSRKVKGASPGKWCTMIRFYSYPSLEIGCNNSSIDIPFRLTKCYGCSGVNPTVPSQTGRIRTAR